MDFRSRKFKNPIVRLIGTTVRTKGSYTFEVFAQEGRRIRQFNLRFLPNKEFWVVNFIKNSNQLSIDSEPLQEIISKVENLFFTHRNQWEGKKSISEVTFNFIALLINNQTADIPKDILSLLTGEITRIFKNTDVCKLDVKGRPYFSSARFGKFFITDIGNIEPEDYERNGIKSGK